MTGSEMVKALVERLGAALPGTLVRLAFSGAMARRPKQPVLSVGLLNEERADGVHSAELGAWLYTPAQADAADLFAAVCGALEDMPCTVRSVARGEAKYDGAVDCIVTPCTVALGLYAGEESRTAVSINGEACFADGVSVSIEAQNTRYGSVGEERPHTAVTGTKTYRVTLTGFSGAPALTELDNFVLEAAGVRYAPCAWKKIEADRLVLEAGGAEKITENGEGE